MRRNQQKSPRKINAKKKLVQGNAQRKNLNLHRYVLLRIYKRLDCSIQLPGLRAKREVLGIISTRFNWKFILNIISSAKVSYSGEIFIINKDGLVIASKNKDDILKKRLSTWEAFEHISQGQNMGFYTKKAEKD